MVNIIDYALVINFSLKTFLGTRIGNEESLLAASVLFETKVLGPNLYCAASWHLILPIYPLLKSASISQMNPSTCHPSPCQENN